MPGIILFAFNMLSYPAEEIYFTPSVTSVAECHIANIINSRERGIEWPSLSLKKSGARPKNVPKITPVSLPESAVARLNAKSRVSMIKTCCM